MERRIQTKFLEWKAQKEPLPLMLLGARQTGKTYLIEAFIKQNFKHYISLNFLENDDYASFFQKTLNAREIVKNIELYFDRKIDVSNTVFFFDEIQVCEEAIASLKFFAESGIPYKIVTAGSLLGVKLNRMKKPFPVGKVQIEYLYPMDFEEFLWAMDQKMLADEIKNHFETNVPMTEIIHSKALDLYLTYLCIGGMPANVAKFVGGRKDLMLFDTQTATDILTGYLADMTKYSDNVDAIKIHQIYRSMPAQLAKPQTKFMYKVVETGSKREKYETAIEWLLQANILLQCNLVNFVQTPLSAYVVDNYFKLYLSDVGLLVNLARIRFGEIMQRDSMLFLGFLAENYVAQTLVANRIELYYWNSGNKAEVDFIANLDAGIIPIEVKAARNVRSKSLNVYVEKYKPAYSIRVSAKNFGFENNIKSVPLYAVHCIR